MAEPIRLFADGGPTLRLQDSTVMTSGGELYENGHWTVTGPLDSGMYEMVLLPKGDVLGFPSRNGMAPSIYHSKSRTWIKADDVPEGSIAALGNGLVLIASNDDNCWIYDPAGYPPRHADDMLLPKQREFSLITLADGSALAIGGEEILGVLHKECELFDPKTETWRRTGDLRFARAGCEAVRLQNGQVLVMGGIGDSPADETSCELYKPSTGQWTQTGSMLEGRYRFTTTVLQDGQVLVIGGYRGSLYSRTYLSSCELYNPKTGTWSRL